MALANVYAGPVFFPGFSPQHGAPQRAWVMDEILPGITEDNPLVICAVEHAARHQTQALACLREARDPRAGPSSPVERHNLLLEALDHVHRARNLLLRAQQTARSNQTAGVLDGHLQKLDAVARSIELQESH